MSLIQKLMLSPNEFLNQQSAEQSEEAKEQASLRLTAMNMLAMREHSRFEIERKLVKRTEIPELIDGVLDRLEADNLLSDERFALSFIRSKANSGFGPYKIKQELHHKGVAEYLYDQALQELAIDWFAIAYDLFAKRTVKLESIDLKEKQKQARYLQGRGFSGDIARAVIEG